MQASPPVSVRERNRAAAPVVAALMIASLVWAAAPASGQCGQEYHATPARSAVPGGAPLAIGDSVLADAVPLLVSDGFEADGMVCRQMSQGLTLLRARGSALPHLVVLALGTNGEVTPGQIDAALSIVGPQRILALVVPHGSVSPSAPTVIRAAAARHPGRVLLLDWDRLVSGHPDWLAPDGVHLGGSAGIAGFAQLIASALPYASSASAATETPAEPGTPITIQPPPGHRGERPSGRHVSPRSRISIEAIEVYVGRLDGALRRLW
jgi:hypothetical protein